MQARGMLEVYRHDGREMHRHCQAGRLHGRPAKPGTGEIVSNKASSIRELLSPLY